MEEFSLQFIGEWHDADGNADEIRLWSSDGLLLGALANDYDRNSHPYVTYTFTASDVFSLDEREECSGYRDWREGFRALFAYEVTNAREELESLL